MDFSTVTMVKHPIDRVWAAMRDDLPKLVDLLEDIESINVELYQKEAHIYRIINIWKACPRLPQSIAKRLNTDIFAWTDRAEWNEEKMECLWVIEPHHFRGKVHCSGSTSFASAMGGRGTRITFAGNIDWNSQELLVVPGVLGEAVHKSIRALVSNLIPKNFRKIAEALATHLDASSSV